jgi:Fe2+ or Zn2+ uptake regulation protein
MRVREWMTMDTSSDLLHRRGYRFTPQRYLILRVMQEAREHLNVEQIAKRVQADNPHVNLSTIYRTLELLQELGLVRASHFPGQQPSYEAVDGKAHYHLVCRGCHAILHLDRALLGNLHDKVEQQYHFHELRLDLLAVGYCEHCWNARFQYEGTKKAMSIS